MSPQMQVMREGKDITLVAFGKIVGYNLKAAEELEKEGISCEVRATVPPHACHARGQSCVSDCRC